MALAIFIGIIIILMFLGNKGKKARANAEYEKLSPKEKTKVRIMDERRKKNDEELIAVILPTINNDGK